MKYLLIGVLSILSASLYAQPSATPGCYISNQGRVYINPTNTSQTTFSSTGNLLDWQSNGSRCVYPNEYAQRTGNSLGNCSVPNQGNGTKFLYNKIACPLDSYQYGMLSIFGILGFCIIRKSKLIPSSLLI